jgi:hypothetical protein
MNSRKSFFTVALIFLSQVIFCQTGYKPGYIITLSNDTIHGEIFYHASQKNHRSCEFRLNKDENAREYEPGEINGYRFNEGKYYISKRVPVYNDTLMVFVEYILKGQASFYYLTLNNETHYYIETHGHLAELSEPEKIKVVDAKMVIIKPKYYGVLHFLMSDGPTLNDEIEKTKLSHQSLIKLGQDYNQLTCNGQNCIVFERKINRVKFTIFPVAGYSVSLINFGDQLQDKSAKGVFAGFSSRLSGIIASDERFGMCLEGYLQYNKTLNLVPGKENYSGALLIYKDIWYYINRESEQVIGPTTIFTKKAKADLDLLTLKIPVIFDFRFGLGKAHYSIGAGPVLSFTLSQNKDFNYRPFTEEYGKSFPGFVYGGIAKTTFNYSLNNKLDVTCGISYDRMFNVSVPDQVLRARFRTVSISAGIRF